MYEAGRAGVVSPLVVHVVAAAVPPLTEPVMALEFGAGAEAVVAGAVPPVPVWDVPKRLAPLL